MSLQFQFLYYEKLFFDLSTKIYKVNKTYLGVFRSYSREVHSFLKSDKGD